MTAIVGSILKIKPIMKVDDEGRLVVVGKAMGRKKALKNLVENMFDGMDLNGDDPVFISHGDCIEDVEYVKNLILERLPKTKIFVNYIGAVIGSHSGAGTLAIFHKGKKR
jgi:DegV family protein with EDD domain